MRSQIALGFFIGPSVECVAPLLRGLKLILDQRNLFDCVVVECVAPLLRGLKLAVEIDGAGEVPVEVECVAPLLRGLKLVAGLPDAPGEFPQASNALPRY